MKPYQDCVRHIAKSPEGSKVAALFDLDGTLIAGHSVKDLFMERLMSGQVSPKEALDLVTMSVRFALKTGDFETALADSLMNLKGESEKHYIELGEKVFRNRLAPMVFPEMKAIIREHRERGHQLAIISSATDIQVEPIARYLGIEHVMCTRLEVKRGKYTGKVEGQPCYGNHKFTAARAFAEANDVSLEDSFFYSNGSEDMPLLEQVGHPVAIAPDAKLREEAAWNNWLIHDFDSRGSTGVGDVARTLGTFTSILPSFLAGLPFRLLGGSHKDSLNFSLAMWSQVASLISGLKLIIEGEQYLWSHRPAVFVFNHQSAMDTVIMARLIQRDVVSIAKKEILRQPIMGPAMWYAGTVFIDRDNVKDPKTLLQPAVTALAEGKSVVMAPEGTRSKDEKLGPFKPGAFHLAMQAGVPVVPIVIHNALDALPNKSMVIHPAEVKVTVLEPIPTDNWTGRSVIKACRDVRKRYLDVLGQ